MTALWKRTWNDLAKGLSKDALELLNSMRIRRDLFPTSGLSRFASPVPRRDCRARFALRVLARRVRWSHAGVRVRHESALLEVNGVPLARVKLSPSKSHKKGSRFEGSKNLFLTFDHGSAVRGEADLSYLMPKHIQERSIVGPIFGKSCDGEDATVARKE
jgi:hypothetical protein